MNITRLTLFASAALLCLSAHAQTDRADSGFMKDAAEAGSAEVEASTLAQSKAKRPETRAFAQQMISDHTKLAGSLKTLAASKHVDLPASPSVTQKAEIKLIDVGDDNKFDARYAEHFGVKAHEDTIKLFEKAAAGAKDPDVKAFAQTNLPQLRHHLEMAQQLAQATK